MQAIAMQINQIKKNSNGNAQIHFENKLEQHNLVPLVAIGGKTTDMGLISWEAQKVVDEIRYPTQFSIYFF